jgi:small subunit ribosomal protein S3
LGQKTHPIGFRLGIIRTWNSRWYAPGNKVADLLHEDLLIKKYISRRLENAGISSIQISRAPKKVSVDIHTSRPGIVIGRKGAEVDKLRDELRLLTGNDIVLNIVEVRKPELDAALVADSIARQLEGRVSFRRAMKKSLAATMKMGAVGIKVQCAGRLGGAEIARTEKYRNGRVPLHTLRADIDYATATAHTTYGCIGVKVWICRGEIMGKGRFVGQPEQQEAERPAEQQARRRHPERRPRAGGGKRPRGRVRKAGTSDETPKGRRPDAPSQRGAQKPPRPKKTETKTDTRKTESKKTDSKKTETKKPEAKQPQAKKPATKSKDESKDK